MHVMIGYGSGAKSEKEGGMKMKGSHNEKGRKVNMIS